jgi:hypothetical protein
LHITVVGIFYSEEEMIDKQQNASQHGVSERPFPKRMRCGRFGNKCFKEVEINTVISA